MSQRVITFCDWCDKQKDASNHWFLGWEWAGGISFTYPETRILDGEDVKDFCGRECAQKFLENFLAAPQTASPEPQANDGGSVPEGANV